MSFRHSCMHTAYDAGCVSLHETGADYFHARIAEADYDGRQEVVQQGEDGVLRRRLKVVLERLAWLQLQQLGVVVGCQRCIAARWRRGWRDAGCR